MLLLKLVGMSSNLEGSINCDSPGRGEFEEGKAFCRDGWLGLSER
jgi:hypothetical protein